MMQPLDVVAAGEWKRFVQGWHSLEPGAGPVPGAPPRVVHQGPAGAGTITIPGWNQVIKVGPGVAVSRADFKLYYQQQRSGKDLGQDPAVTRAVAGILAKAAARQTTTQPGYSLSIGQIMTSIDNMQDILSTLATVGRLAIWAAPRLGLRAVPVVGWVVLAADILNLFNFFGMVASPVYALLCSGPRDALAAGVPAAVLKAALCKEAWTQARLNPFSRSARAARSLRALGKLPGVSNMIEVLQVTDTFFGYGLSLGALYGTAMEILFAGTADVPFSKATLNTGIFTGSFTDPWKKVVQEYPPTQLSAMLRAARMAQMAPIIAGVHDDYSDEEHLASMAAMVAASSMVSEFMSKGPHQELMRELLPGQWPAPSRRPAYLEDAVPGITDDDAGIGRWWIEGNPRSLDGERLVPLLAQPCVSAVTSFLKPRRNRIDMPFYGACLNQVTDHWWTLIGGDAEALKWQLQPDYLILTSMMVEGLLVRQGEHEGRLWRFWTALRERVAANGGRMLERSEILSEEATSRIALMRLLPVHAEFGPEWARYFANPPLEADPEVGQWPHLVPSF